MALLAGLSLVALVCSIAFVWKVIHRDSAIPQWILWFALLFAWLPLDAARVWYRLRKKQKVEIDPERPLQLSFNDAGVHGWALEDLQLQWEQVNSVRVGKQFVDINHWPTPNDELHLTSVPLRAFSDEQLRRFTDLIERVTPRFQIGEGLAVRHPKRDH